MAMNNLIYQNKSYLPVSYPPPPLIDVYVYTYTYIYIYPKRYETINDNKHTAIYLVHESVL